MAEQTTVQSVERTFVIIELLCEKGESGVTELAALSGLNKTTVFRLLSTLIGLGYAYKNPATEKYGLTLKFLQISGDTIANIDIRRYARRQLEIISAETGETVHLVERVGNDIVYIDKVEARNNSVRMASHIGLSLPMVYTAVGKSIMARLNPAEAEKIWQTTDIFSKTANTITDYVEFLKELENVRLNGYAVDNEENERGVRCVAAAIGDIYGDYRYAVSVSAPAARMNEKKIIEIGKLVKNTAEIISGGVKQA